MAVRQTRAGTLSRAVVRRVGRTGRAPRAVSARPTMPRPAAAVPTAGLRVRSPTARRAPRVATTARGLEGAREGPAEATQAAPARRAEVVAAAAMWPPMTGRARATTAAMAALASASRTARAQSGRAAVVARRAAQPR